MFKLNSKRFIFYLSIFFLFITIGGNIYAQSSLLKISIPPAAGLNIKVIGYDGFKTDTIAKINLNQSGKGSVKVKYKGFALLFQSDEKVYPIILKNKVTNFSYINYDSLPTFSGESENSFLYNYIVKKRQLERKKMILTDAYKFFKEGDNFLPFIIEEDSSLKKERKSLEQIIADSTQYMASTLLAAKLLMESTSKIETIDDLKAKKDAFILFIFKNYSKFQHSDIIQQLAAQYVMMNEYVISGQENHYNQVITDVGDWIKNFENIIPANDIVNFYIEIYLGRSMTTLAELIAEKYFEYAQCKSSNISTKTFNKGNLFLNSFNIGLSSNKNFSTTLEKMGNTDKILFFFWSECTVCYPMQISMNNFMLEQGLQFPSVTVFSDKDTIIPLAVLSNIQKAQFYYIVSDKLYKLIGIEKFPAFIVLGKDNSIKQKYYSIEELKKYLITIKN